MSKMKYGNEWTGRRRSSRWSASLCGLLIAGMVTAACGGPSDSAAELCRDSEFSGNDSNYDLKGARVYYQKDLELLVFEQQVNGVAGATPPTAAGQLDGAPVKGYVFPTSLSPSAAGFDATEGILALAATAHPDFDDTPLWDEDIDGDYGNDGVIWHSHWVVLNKDNRAPAGYSVKATEKNSVLPPTNPGMPMYMDSPGLTVVRQGDRIRILVPAWRISGKIDFQYDALSAFMQVSTKPGDPMLAVHKVYEICSGDLSLPFQVQRAK